MQNFDAHKEEFITGRAAELQRLGASPEDSSRMARQEADMIVASGATGQNYISRVSGAQKELKNLHQQVNRMGPVGRWDSLIQESSRRHGVDPNLVRAVMMVESGGNPRAESKKGAIGLMQLMPETAKGLGVKDPWDPAQNIEGGAKYLRENLGKFGNTTMALAAYNAGPGNVQKHRGVPPFEETQNYVSKVLDLYWQGSPAPKATPGKKARIM
ncbi:MAG: lytic transglycosylase domain-containing protein [Deltaproteobacteria bacterium]|nr:lytic transglycosylase domain-containing protein [Deltaproteobacteria bacterium]